MRDKNGELGKARHLAASRLNQSLAFFEDDFSLLVFISPVDGHAISISRRQASNVCDAITHNAVKPKLGLWFCYFGAGLAGNHSEILSVCSDQFLART